MHQSSVSPPPPVSQSPAASPTSESSNAEVERGRRYTRDSEATELEEVASDPQHEPRARHDSSPDHIPLRRLATTERQSSKRFQGIRRFWRHHVSVIVPHDLCRDHLALERTYLGYFRTATTLAMSAVVVAQLFPLRESGTHMDKPVTFAKLAKPLSAMLVAASIATVLLGTVRVWRQQEAMVRGRILTASWETMGIAVLSGAVMVVLLVLTLVAETSLQDGNSDY